VAGATGGGGDAERASSSLVAGATGGGGDAERASSSLRAAASRLAAVIGSIIFGVRGGWRAAYCDQKSANREIRVWHFVIEKGY
jgi:hypothetical protein